MRTLFLMRHAKSSWDDASLADFDRPLNGRGERTAPLMGELMKREAFAPDIILSSPAERAKQTAIAAKKAGGLDAEMTFDDRIYEASPNALRQVASEIDDRHSSVMLVGHNPGMEGFVRYLTGQLEPMPTAALAVIDLDIEGWADVAENSGTLRNVFRPKELTSA
jgi:phosphohistidine phosphatase